MRRSVRHRSSGRWCRKISPRLSTWLMPPTSVPHDSSRARTSTASPYAARSGRARGGRPRSQGPTRPSTLKSIGRTSASAAPRANGQRHGGSLARRRATGRSSSSLRSKTVRGVPPGRSARGRVGRGDACDSHRKRSTRRCRRRGRGAAVRRASNSISSGPGSKERSRRAYGALGCGAPDIGASRKLTSNS
jgi:hypothetical protein